VLFAVCHIFKLVVKSLNVKRHDILERHCRYGNVVSKCVVDNRDITVGVVERASVHMTESKAALGGNG